MSEIRRQARLVTIDEESALRRIDNFLVSELKGIPRSRIYSMIRKGEVRVNKGRIRAAYKLKPGDIVRIPPVSAVAERVPDRSKSDWIRERILYEDDWLMVLDKPSGLAVHGGSGISQGAIELLRSARPELHYLELVHRLDRDTSGCLLLAKKRSALRSLHEAFRGGRIDKRYLALMHGELKTERDVELPLVVEHRRNGERFVRTGKDGKPARSVFTPREKFANWTLAEVRLHTGRTHQIRVHAAAIGHGLAGDRRYGTELPAIAGLDRLFLHASSLSLAHPATGDRIEFSAPADERLEAVLAALAALGAA